MLATSPILDSTHSEDADRLNALLSLVHPALADLAAHLSTTPLELADWIASPAVADRIAAFTAASETLDHLRTLGARTPARDTLQSLLSTDNPVELRRLATSLLGSRPPSRSPSRSPRRAPAGLPADARPLPRSGLQPTPHVHEPAATPSRVDAVSQHLANRAAEFAALLQTGAPAAPAPTTLSRVRQPECPRPTGSLSANVSAEHAAIERAPAEHAPGRETHRAPHTPVPGARSDTSPRVRPDGDRSQRAASLMASAGAIPPRPP